MSTIPSPLDWRTPVLGVTTLMCLTTFTLGLLSSSKRHPPYPPGPPGEFLLGNLRSMPLKDEEAYFTELAKEYGSIVYLNLLGKHLVVLNDVKVANELLDKRSAFFSGRPRLPMTEILGVDDNLGFRSTSHPSFRPVRRHIQRYLLRDNVSTPYNRTRWVQESRTLAQTLVDQPQDWEATLVYYATALIMELIVGKQITSKDDVYVKFAQDVSDYVLPPLKPPEGSLVDLFPFMKYLPDWFPGNYWVGKARFARQITDKFRDYAVEDTVERMAQGTASPSFLVSFLEDLQDEAVDPKNKLTIEDAKGMMMTLFTGGTETTSSSLSNFFAALLLFPHIQEVAQAEIDRVLSNPSPTGLQEGLRLPDFSDRGSLKYLECIMWELERWKPALPLGVPRLTTADDVYNGMYIPEGTVVMTNLKAMGLDENVYKDPETFDPSRYLPAPLGRGEPPLGAVFGFGRRICPGRFLVDDTLWISIATILATLNISRPVGENGKEYLPNIEWAAGISSHPKQFPCRIEVRSEAAKRLLLSAAD